MKSCLPLSHTETHTELDTVVNVGITNKLSAETIKKPTRKKITNP